jgi:membrane protease YdiL (CAAX protease family)
VSRLADLCRCHGFLILAVLAGPLVSQAMPLAARLIHHELPHSSLDPATLVTSLLLAPVLEELVFRGGVQSALDVTRLGRIRRAGVTLGNVFTSALFAVAHLFVAPAWFAASVFLPSLVFGRLAQLYRTLLPCILMHVWYNACFIWAVS